MDTARVGALAALAAAEKKPFFPRTDLNWQQLKKKPFFPRTDLN